MENILDVREGQALGAANSTGKPVASWSAIIAGAFVAASVSLVLVALGSGLGFASVSPWSGHGVSAKTFAVTAAIWLIVTQWLSSAVGGYMAGRLRTRWIGTHAHEVFFRDTAHGFVTWAVSTVLVASILASSTFATLGAGSRAVAAAAPAAAEASVKSGYQLDRLFRSSGSSAANGNDPRAEATHIIVNAATAGDVSTSDRSYLAEVVAAHSGVSQEEAQKRVDEYLAAAKDAETQMKAEADAARKAAAQASIYLALSMLVGAFIASVSAALGGRLRDEHI
jgi:hypothetical protein